MIKKISFLILAAAILAIGTYAFIKTNYWERSIRIFNMGSGDSFNGRIGHGGFGTERGSEERRGFPGRDNMDNNFRRPEIRELPDSIRTRLEARRGRPRIENGVTIDSLRQRPFDRTRQGGGRIAPQGGFRDGGGRDRGEFGGGKKISLGNVQWFLAVMALFTVVAIYLDKAVCLIKRKRRQKAV
jgi:hypothetical protein